MKSVNFVGINHNIDKRAKIKIDPHFEIIDSNSSEYLIFSPINQKIIKISKERFDKLRKKNNLEIDISEELLQTGLFINKGQTINAKNKKKTLTVVFEGCNSECKYCYLDGEFKKFDFEFLKKAINQFLNEDEGVRLGFHGGEAQYSREVMKRLVELANDKFTDIAFYLQTNGAMNPDFTRWVNKNIDSIVVSTDGPEDIQNKFRPLRGGRNSFEKVDKALDILGENKDVTAHTVITNRNLDRIQETIDYFESKGIKKMEFAPVKETEATKKNNLKRIDLERYTQETFKVIKDNYERDNQLVFYGYYQIVQNKSCMVFHKNSLAVFPENIVGKCLQYTDLLELGKG